MCGFCGCSDNVEKKEVIHNHSHEYDESRLNELKLEQNILHKNDLLAERVRGILFAKGIFCLNLLSSPGSGKTFLLEKTLSDWQGAAQSAAIAGDCASQNDALRLAKTKALVEQVNTGNMCHLDAHLVLHCFERLNLAKLKSIFIENVGNLVCPASFDLGENKRVILMSVCEGEDKPEKYPAIFHKADCVLLSKIDLAKQLDYDIEFAKKAIQNAAPKAEIFEISAKTGTGMKTWFAWLDKQISGIKRL